MSAKKTARPAAPKPVEEIELGDNVYVGEPHPDKVHWIVDRIPPSARVVPTYPNVRLVSPMSGRSRLACLDELRLHSKAVRDA